MDKNAYFSGNATTKSAFFQEMKSEHVYFSENGENICMFCFESFSLFFGSFTVCLNSTFVLSRYTSQELEKTKNEKNTTVRS